jgi:hypothetical protein
MVAIEAAATKLITLETLHFYDGEGEMSKRVSF